RLEPELHRSRPIDDLRLRQRWMQSHQPGIATPHVEALWAACVVTTRRLRRQAERLQEPRHPTYWIGESYRHNAESSVAFRLVHPKPVAVFAVSIDPDRVAQRISYRKDAPISLIPHRRISKSGSAQPIGEHVEGAGPEAEPGLPVAGAAVRGGGGMQRHHACAGHHVDPTTSLSLDSCLQAQRLEKPAHL